MAAIKKIQPRTLMLAEIQVSQVMAKMMNETATDTPESGPMVLL